MIKGIVISFSGKYIPGLPYNNPITVVGKIFNYNSTLGHLLRIWDLDNVYGCHVWHDLSPANISFGQSKLFLFLPLRPSYYGGPGS